MPLPPFFRVRRTDNTAESIDSKVLRIHVTEARDLPISDFFSRSSDPYVVVRLGKSVRRSSTIKRSLAPTFSDALFDLPCLSPQTDVVTVEVWDWDMLKSEFLGQVSIPVKDLLPPSHERAVGWNDPTNDTQWLPISRRRMGVRGRTVKTQGELSVKMGFLETQDIAERSSAVSAPSSEGESFVLILGAGNSNSEPSRRLAS
ncbi:hypothetical protein M427DRAFT_359249 [Gonapodya prolifera JEL478]|uniref:C2 domain-containing protein n=1 Tax=Gonapodya prolifera (strain JEL478) TaxID=1344416 RepID=A0A139ABT8_GONPJ|nr:hypothetical protein M427DRAFT_359249 [Gonapodya prolifera JEL478]|eukprot:KXS13883.1 hypothetical protein M427DRAFT_359249 [Gonapodya prolifera JEL478]